MSAAGEKPNVHLTLDTVLADEQFDVLRLALQLADDAAYCEIESACRTVNSGAFDWYDLCQADKLATSFVARADRYLTLRGEQATGFRMLRHPAFPHLVRFEATP